MRELIRRWAPPWNRARPLAAPGNDAASVVTSRRAESLGSTPPTPSISAGGREDRDDVDALRTDMGWRPLGDLKSHDVRPASGSQLALRLLKRVQRQDPPVGDFLTYSRHFESRFASGTLIRAMSDSIPTFDKGVQVASQAGVVLVEKHLQFVAKRGIKSASETSR